MSGTTETSISSKAASKSKSDTKQQLPAPTKKERGVSYTQISGIGFSTIRRDDAKVETKPGSLDGAVLYGMGDKKLFDKKAPYTTLQERLDALSKAEASSIPKEALAEINRQKQELAESDLIFNSAKVGDYVQNFVLPDGAGRRVELRRLLKKGPVVLVFYRGNWCDYCKLQLAALHNAYPHVKAAGGHLVAISPQNLDQTLSAYEANSSLFNVLSDMGNVVARRFGITFRMSPNLLKIYKKFWKIDLGKYYDCDDTDIIPAPATFVIDVTGRITFAFVNPDYTKRASLTEVIEAVRNSRHPNLSQPLPSQPPKTGEKCVVQ